MTRCALFRAASVVLTLLAALLPVFTALLGAAAVLTAPGQPATVQAASGFDSPARAESFDIDAKYDPDTRTLRVTCAMKLKIVEDTSSISCGLRTSFGPADIATGPGLCEWKTAGVWEDWREYRTTGFFRAGDTLAATWTYEGTPRDYDSSQDRYWSWAKAGAIWVTDTNAWMPSPYFRWSAADADIQLDVTVPDDWTVFAPGEPVSWEPPARDGWRTFTYSSQTGNPNPPCWWLAAPYQEVASGEIAGVPYSVWQLPGWEEQGAQLAAETPKMMSFLADVLGGLPPIKMRVIQVDPDQGGGISSTEGLASVSPLGTKSKFGLSSQEALWLHELAHSLAYFGDEGWSEFLALYYVAVVYPERFPGELGSAHDYFLTSVAANGDFGVIDATKRHFNQGDLPEWHAYVYMKPALIWNMYRDVFGEPAMRRLLAALQRDYPLTDWSETQGNWASPAYWDDAFALYRREAVAAAEAEGGSEAATMAGAFFDRWFSQKFKMDLALEPVACEGPGEAKSGGSGGSPGGSNWTVTFTIAEVRDGSAPPAAATVPAVEVAVTTEGGPPVTARIPLKTAGTQGRIEVPRRPLTVILDPNKWLLDYDYSNNVAEVGAPGAVSQALQIAVLLSGIALAVIIALLLRRRPVAAKPTPDMRPTKWPEGGRYWES